MRSSLVLVAVAALGLINPGNPVLAQQDAADSPPPFDVYVSVLPTKFQRMQLTARPSPRTFSCTASVVEAGAVRALSALDLVIAPGSSEQKSLEVGSYSFRFRATVPPAADRVETEVVVSVGAKPVSRFRGVTTFPEAPKPEAATVPAR